MQTKNDPTIQPNNPNPTSNSATTPPVSITGNHAIIWHPTKSSAKRKVIPIHENDIHNASTNCMCTLL